MSKASRIRKEGERTAGKGVDRPKWKSKIVKNKCGGFKCRFEWEAVAKSSCPRCGYEEKEE